MMFGESLIESGRHAHSGAAWSKVASVGLQSAALMFLLILPLLHIERLQFVPPPPTIRIASAPPMHAMAASSAAASSTPVYRTEQLVQPTAWSRHPYPVVDREAAGPEPTAVAASLGTCVVNCAGTDILTSLVRSAPANVAPPPGASKPVVVSEMQLGDLVNKVLPQYPPLAKVAGIHGTVLLTALVGKDGRVENVNVISGHPVLARAARGAVLQWRYRPYLLNREPVEVQTTVTVHFTLAGASD
jgi:protein TonB